MGIVFFDNINSIDRCQFFFTKNNNKKSSLITMSTFTSVSSMQCPETQQAIKGLESGMSIFLSDAQPIMRPAISIFQSDPNPMSALRQCWDNVEFCYYDFIKFVFLYTVTPQV